MIRITCLCKKLLSLLLIGLIPLAAVAAITAHDAHAASVLHVKPGAAGNCSTWADACSLQTALGQAVSGDEIWVMAGVHYPGSERSDTFELNDGVAVFGGFQGIENDRSQRDWKLHITVLSGDIDQNDASDTNGVVSSADDIVGNNVYHVVTSNGNSETAVLDGLIITAGQANGSDPDQNGGGIYNNSSILELTNIILSGNYAGNGGGIYNNAGSSLMINVTLNGNSASSNGGGMFNLSSSPTMKDAAFRSNSASGGGGIYNHMGSSPELTNVTFSGNSAVAGGGMVNDSGSNPTLTNAILSGNSAGSVGAGMYNYNSNPVLTNVTFSGNSAGSQGGGMKNYSSNPTLTNCILWGDSAPSGAEIYDENSTPVISYSDVQGGYSGTGNINTDPSFIDAAGPDDLPGTSDDNLRLGGLSTAIDAGDNSAVPGSITSDLDGKTRFVDVEGIPDTGNGTLPIVDMGAYEARNYYVYLPGVLKK